ncbi:penicillin-binding transpeptidase domain-containing protein [Antrihabitans stalactiti]|uniref:Penicillin-binding protein n=1 Tax=Antrihabitans stalactiti TaxID=2584121 RepID=A0A848KD57_9NOCA|nr:penicillin-binding transpeptidase domain-containing protein [Antrihabitans stalactiti]NMN95666.1 penicillin-binding protein [Antrihabitans stalactiti]
MIDRVRTEPRALFAAVLSLTLIVVGCSSDKPDQPAKIAQQFVTALNNDDGNAAAALTSDPAKAADAIGKMYDGLGKDVKFDVKSTEESGAVELAAQWTLGQGEAAKRWSYTTRGKASDSGQGWRIDWDPAILVAGLTEGHTVRFLPTHSTPARVLDRAGQELMTEQVVTLVNVAPSADAAAVAPLLAQIDPAVTPASLSADIAAGQGNPVTALILREQDLAKVEAPLSALPGVTLAKQTRLLTTDRTLTSPTFSGVTELWQEAQDAAAGWSVEVVADDGTATKLVGEDAKPTPDLTTTLDLGLQQAAEAAVAPLQQQAAIVAIRPSTGGILAVAQSASADAQGPIALTGLYPPGSTFKTVTVSAALQAGGLTPDTVLPCPGSANIEGRTIPNDENFDLGQVPLHTAFARSCNTTMGRLAVGLPPNGLQKAAEQFGLGVDYVTPGLVTVTGTVPVADTPAARVESGIGQGSVTASPFGMALVAATIAHGSLQAPMFVDGRRGTGNRTPSPLPANITDQLSTMMRETVTAGTATILNDIPDLRGKTGTAEHENGAAHGWFVGIEGDLAFAVFVADAGSSTPALEAAGRFLRNVQPLIPR